MFWIELISTPDLASCFGTLHLNNHIVLQRLCKNELRLCRADKLVPKNAKLNIELTALKKTFKWIFCTNQCMTPITGDSAIKKEKWYGIGTRKGRFWFHLNSLSKFCLGNHECFRMDKLYVISSHAGLILDSGSLRLLEMFRIYYVVTRNIWNFTWRNNF